MITRAEKEQVESMTLQQIRAERERVEGQILNLINGFKADTGLAVVGVEVEQLQTTPFGFGFDVVTTGVRLQLEDL